ncbi:MAG: amidase [Nitrospinaceae bacterium]|nr:amidase [Nitrospinaceae bacterium]MBT3433622.1 amidase [Nitrospinaceae bacterium]MBT3821219.1 amidase [Nitrospinaceae bacterium]MBT4094168.1 amidase [Nitrospinaceae bacterium]MBT4430024.1 amidase [Nitrospinaceae bacterium]
MSNLWELTLSEGIKKISQGLLTTTEWTEALLTRIDVCEERIHAWTALDKQGALDSAKQLDASHSEPGPLTGAQIGVKDIINVKGLPCEANSPILKGVIPNEDAHCVARLREAGAVIMGKTVTTQFATGDPSETRNPWNLAHSPGGSSSGSAAAVATGMVPAALGSQTGGSVLRPSAYCGVIGFKPSYGLISRAGVVEVSWTFDHIGTLTRSVEDAALLLAHMAGPDDADETTQGFESPQIVLHTTSKPQKACYPKSGIHKYASAEVCDWIDRGVEKLRAGGVEIVEIEYPVDFQVLHDTHRMIMNVDGATYHEKMFSENADKYRPVIRTLVENGLKSSALEYARGLRQRGRLMRDLDNLLAEFDFMVLPSFQEPPALAEESTGSAFFNEPATQPGLPAITLPLGRGENNLPFGIQFIGRKFEDFSLLAAAAWCEAELGWGVEIANP